MTRPVIGFAGPGAMGAPIAVRLAQAGFDVSVWARDAIKALPIVEVGGRTVSDRRDLLAADVVVSCLRDDAVVREFYLGPGGMADGARDDQVFVEHATFDPALAGEISGAMEAHGAAFIDAPVSGGPSGASAGTLAVMMGGDPAAVQRIRTVVDVYCATVVHAGASGAGQTVKLVNQLLVGIHAVAAAEAAALIRRTNIPPESALNALMGGWGASKMLEHHFLAAIADDFAGNGATLGKFADVFDLVDRFERRHGVQSDVLTATSSVIHNAVSNHHADDSFAALITEYHRSPKVAEESEGTPL